MKPGNVSDNPEPKHAEIPTHTVNPLTLVVIGAVNHDEVITLNGPLVPAASNSANWRRAAGGVATNAAIAASAQSACHISVTLIGAIGDDLQGKQIKRFLGNYNLQLKLQTVSDQSSGQYTAVLDSEGELILGLADTRVTESVDAYLLKELIGSSNMTDALLFDSNLSSAAIGAICTEFNTKHRIALAASPVKAMRLLNYAPSIDLLFLNRLEAAMMTNYSKESALADYSVRLNALGFKHHIITDGAQPIIVGSDDQVHAIDVPPLNEADTSVNGAGDALAGASVAAFLAGESLLSSVTNFGLPVAAQMLKVSQSVRFQPSFSASK